VIFLGDFSFICKNILKKLSCYHHNYFRYFMYGKYNGFVSKARVSACMYFLVLCCFERYVLLNFKAAVAKTWTYHVLKIVFLESTFNRLSFDASFLHYYRQSVDIKSKFFQLCNRKRRESYWYYAVSNLMFYWISRLL
jgi:hypothetical protein